MKDKKFKDIELVKEALENKSFNFLEKLYENRKKVFTNILLLIIIPILIYLFGQLLCNGKIIFESSRMLFNFLLIYFVIGIFYSLTGKLKPACILSNIFVFVLGLINYTITMFRGTPLVPWDIFSVNVALTVLPTFTFTFSTELLIAIILFLISLVISIFSKTINITKKAINRSLRIIIIVSIIIFFVLFYTTDLINAFSLDHNWDPKEEYHNNGLLASLLKQSKNLIINLPDGYSIDALKEIMSQTELDINKSIEEAAKKLEEEENNKDTQVSNEILDNTISNTIIENTIAEVIIETPKEDSKETPHIIAIMNESLADLSVISDFKVSEDYLPFIRNLEKNTVKGNVHVSVFGATTPNTEWEFLTANSMAFVPYRTVPYQQYITRKSYSLATILKEQGYSTSAIHSYYPQGYNRNIVYPLIGFDKFYHLNNMENINYIREYPDDESTYKQILSIFENKKDGEKIFNFTLTMQNHGSYTDPNFEATIFAENNEYPKVNQYLSLIKETDNAFKDLINYFENYDEPVVILIFGDHMPYVEDEFYNKLLSAYEDPESKEAKETKYITPYLIWANYDFDYKSYDIENISINYLSSLLLDIADVDKTLYLEFLDTLREEVPIITGNGYMDKENIYHDFSEENDYTNLIKQYNYLQYNNMFDKNNKLVELFTVKKELN